ncbi:MAG TPA: glycosyltransferase, partial [Candidatus Sulfotelmatobacter sp.]|nr:glycosyltransferase [Candidatus Sulfotelmatobacter sp.]
WADAAVFFRDNHPESLRDAVEKVLQNAALRRQMADRAYRRAQECFTADRMVSEYLNLYKSLVPAQALSA